MLLSTSEGLSDEAGELGELGGTNAFAANVFAETQISEAATSDLATAIGEGAGNDIITAFTSASASEGAYISQLASLVASTARAVIGSFPLYTFAAIVSQLAFFALPASEWTQMGDEAGQALNFQFLDLVAGAGQDVDIVGLEQANPASFVWEEIDYLVDVLNYTWSADGTKLLAP